MSRILPTPLASISGHANTENVFHCLNTNRHAPEGNQGLIQFMPTFKVLTWVAYPGKNVWRNIRSPADLKEHTSMRSNQTGSVINPLDTKNTPVVKKRMLIVQLFAFWLHFTSEPQSMNHSRKNTSQFVNVYMNAISFYKKDYKRDNVLW